MHKLYQSRLVLAAVVGTMVAGLAGTAFAVGEDAGVTAITTGIGTMLTNWAVVAPVAIAAGFTVWGVLYLIRKAKRGVA